MTYLDLVRQEPNFIPVLFGMWSMGNTQSDYADYEFAIRFFRIENNILSNLGSKVKVMLIFTLTNLSTKTLLSLKIFYRKSHFLDISKD